MVAPLPVEAVIPELRAVLTSRAAAILVATPGAGKTTLVPPALLGEPWLAGRSILMLEPRRLAARAAACRMAELRGEEPGATIGYRTRFESCVSKSTRIEVVTEGILTRRVQKDPALEGVGLVIFDEVHERHLETDLALALCRDAQESIRPDLKFLAMSATLDANALARLLGEAPVVRLAAAQFPVEIRYLAEDATARTAETALRGIRRALDEEEGDVLVFLPGAGEIRRVHESLGSEEGLAVLDLYGDLSREDQDRALRPDPRGRRRVILSTNIAESSLTIEGIRVVVDSGWMRVPRYEPRVGMSRLDTVRVSRASADQRAGRAGRLGPGVCYRLWSRPSHNSLAEFNTPEILSTDLAGLALDLACWGTPVPAQLRWLDAPPAGAYGEATALLRALGALDQDGRATETGRSMNRLPLHPRLARMLVAAREEGQASLAADIAAILSERDLFPSGEAGSADLHLRLDALAAFRRGRHRPPADRGACGRVDRVARQLRGAGRPASVEADADRAGLLIAAAYPDRIARRREKRGERYLLANGRGARLEKSDPLGRNEWLAIASLDAGGNEGKVFLAAALSEEQVRDGLADRIVRSSRVEWSVGEECVIAAEEESLGGIVIASRPAEPSAEALAAAICDGIRRMGIECLAWTPEARQWQARALCLRAWFPDEEWPDSGDAALLARLETWLAPHLLGARRRADLASVDLQAALANLLPPNLARQFDTDAPTHLAVPSGSRLQLEYIPGQPPALEVKLQEMFGLAETPRVARGRVAVTLHLLSPAKRPIQVTQDLRSFWEKTYPEVKRELSRRYPRHPWPDDPWSAKPTARTVRRNR